MVRNELIHFVERAKCFDQNAKLKLILLAAGKKPAAFVALRIYGKNLDDKSYFEKHLREQGILFEASRPRSFEEIVRIKGKVVVWKLAGVWYGYDLFVDQQARSEFRKYVQLVRKNHSSADKLGGKIYGYPSCCIAQFIREHNLKWLKKAYSYYEYYAKLHAMDVAFPFVCHTPCSPTCAQSQVMNAENDAVVRSLALTFYKEYSRRRTLSCEFVRDGESDIYKNPLLETEILWSQKDGHEYTFVATEPLDGKYYLFPHLVRSEIPRGKVFEGTVVVQYDYSILKLGRAKRLVRDFHHQRKLPLLGK